MRISDSVNSQKISLNVSYILIGICLVPIGPPFLSDLGVNSEQLALGALLVLAPIYILIKGLGSVQLSRMLLISVLIAVLVCGIAVMVTEVASLSYVRMAINIALAYFFIQAIVLPLKNKNVPIELSFCISVIFMLVAYWYLYVIPDGIVLTKLNLRDDFDVNINAFLNLFNLALIFLICLCFFSYDVADRKVRVDSYLKRALSLIALIILITSLLQQSRQNFLVSLLTLAFLERKSLKYLIWILVPLIIFYWEELISLVTFFEYFMKAIIQVSTGVESTRASWISEAYLAFKGVPNLEFEHPFDNTIMTLLVSGGFLVVPFVIAILASVIFIGSRSLLIALAFFLLVNLNDQHLEFSFWLIVISMNYIHLKRMINPNLVGLPELAIQKS